RPEPVEGHTPRRRSDPRQRAIQPGALSLSKGTHPRCSDVRRPVQAARRSPTSSERPVGDDGRMVSPVRLDEHQLVEIEAVAAISD
ncbi:hypothetical protein, partial [Microbacterium mangrovi]|uniref:hypothetical protein n=1 Tax=Microbacterium mangrovi TaxID=1348253 RepID=UPI001E5A4F1F